MDFLIVLQGKLSFLWEVFVLVVQKSLCRPFCLIDQGVVEVF